MKKTVAIAMLLAVAFTTGFTCSKHTPAPPTPPPATEVPPPAAAPAQDQMGTPAEPAAPGTGAPATPPPAEPPASK